MSLNLLKHTSLNFMLVLGGNILQSFLPWLIFIITMRELSLTDSGMLALVSSLSAPIFMFTNLQLGTFITVHQSSDFNISDYITVRSMMNIVAFLLCGVIGVFYGSDVALPLVAFALFRICDGYQEIAHGIYIRGFKNRVFFVSNLLKCILVTSTFYCFVSLSHNLLISLAAMCITLTAVLLFYDRRLLVSRDSLITWNPTMALQIFKKSLPLGLAVFLSSSTTNLPRYVLESYSSKESLALFLSLFFVASGFSRVCSTFEVIYRPILSNAKRDDQSNFLRIYLSLLSLITLFWSATLVMVLVWGSSLLSLIYKHGIFQDSRPLVVLVIAHFILSLSGSLHLLLQVLWQFHIQAKLQVFNLIISSVTSFYVIPIYGISGACYTVLTYATVSLLTSGITTITIIKRHYTRVP